MIEPGVVAESVWMVGTGPLIFLSKLGRLGLLESAADRICVARAVIDEIQVKPDEAARAIALACQSWLSVRQVSNRQAVEILLADLGLGEAETIVLGKEIDAERVVMDDLDARRFARRVGLGLIGTLGLLLAARLKGKITSLRKEIEKLAVGLGGLAGHPVADDGVHWMVGAAAVHADPLYLLFLAPLGELAVRPGVLDHVADLIRVGLVPAKVVVAGVDDKDVALPYLDPLLDHLGGIDLVVTRGVGQVDDGGRAGEELVQVQRGNVLAGRVEVDLAVEMGAQVVGVGQELAVGPICPNRATRWRFRWMKVSHDLCWALLHYATRTPVRQISLTNGSLLSKRCGVNGWGSIRSSTWTATRINARRS